MAIGVFPTVSILEAREALKAAKALIKSGDDPCNQQREAKQLAQYQSALTFEAIAKEWHEQKQRKLDTTTCRLCVPQIRVAYVWHYWSLPNKQVDSSSLIMTSLQRVEKSGPEMARRVLNMCSRIFQYAAATGRIDRDLTFGLKHGLRKYKPGHYASVTLDEMPDLIKTIHMNEARLYRQTHLCLKMMLLTFVRTTELIEARWSEFNFDKAMWIIPAERMKTRKLHKVPLSKQAIAILRELKQNEWQTRFRISKHSTATKTNVQCNYLKGLGYP